MAGKQVNMLDNRTPSTSDYVITTNPINGISGKTFISVLAALIAPNGAPITEYTNYTTLLENTTLPTNFYALVVDGSDEDYTGWVLLQYKGGDRDELASYRVIISQDVYERFLPLAVSDDKTVNVGADKTLLFYTETATGKVSITLINDTASNNSYLEIKSALIDDSEEVLFQIGENNGVIDFNFTDSRIIKTGLLALGFGETTPTSGDGSYPDIPASGFMPVQMARNAFVPKESVDGDIIIGREQDPSDPTPYLLDYVLDNNTGNYAEHLLDVTRAQMRYIGTYESYMRVEDGIFKYKGKRDIATGGSGNETAGMATLVGGTKTVNTTRINTGDIVICTIAALGTVTVPTQVFVAQSSIVDGTSFVITSANMLDTSIILWEIVKLT